MKGPEVVRSAWATVTDVYVPTPDGLPPVDVYLVVLPSRVVALPDGAEVTFGRASECTVVIDDVRMSRQHAAVRRVGGDVWVRDLGSRNGTKARGQVLRDEETRLHAGDLIQVGHADVLVAAVTRGSTLTPFLPPDGREAPAEELEDREEAQAFGGIIVADPAMQKAFRVARRLAQSDATVVITGETGVGKEVVAQQVHSWSPRADAPFVRLNCAAIPETILESELFGHEKGAFTGADRKKVGFVEAADKGTLLLDEIGDMPLSTQVKLLRVLESRAITRVGGTKEINVDVRILCATHRDLRAEVAEKRFREDLFYRISTFTLHVPSLRERKAEITLLAELFAQHFASRLGVARPAFSASATALLLGYSWPGNVRELRNAIEHAIVMADGDTIEPEHLPAVTQGSPAPVMLPRVREELVQAERTALEAALAAEDGNQTRAAKRLGITRRVLIYKMQKLKITRSR
jgi:DNA-binding NtrC family response regulator